MAANDDGRVDGDDGRVDGDDGRVAVSGGQESATAAGCDLADASGVADGREFSDASAAEASNRAEDANPVSDAPSTVDGTRTADEARDAGASAIEESPVGRRGLDDLDLTTRVRRRVLPAVHRIKEPFGGFAQCTQHPSEYVGTVQRGLREFRPDLEAMSFAPEPIASLKVHRDGRLSAGSWVRRRSPLADWQLHVTLFRNGHDTVEIFAHREYSWLRHPYKHYRGEGWDTAAGVERMRDLLVEHDVTFRIE